MKFKVKPISNDQGCKKMFCIVKLEIVNIIYLRHTSHIDIGYTMVSANCTYRHLQ